MGKKVSRQSRNHKKDSLIDPALLGNNQSSGSDANGTGEAGPYGSDEEIHTPYFETKVVYLLPPPINNVAHH